MVSLLNKFLRKIFFRPNKAIGNLHPLSFQTPGVGRLDFHAFRLEKSEAYCSLVPKNWRSKYSHKKNCDITA
jgi:hypothetical protein